ncbi:periplasmic metalloprotease M23B family protein [Iodidimonas muriae]|uniref:Periplasmic metalloprotease M23B family protein n=1 Tax=Iodidimonas muriae TaxID=261467 RepID=A0ABQ2LEX3_9PROT|nr:M23 family metallopeptidase [Iodidimonas muriae]GER07448.1 periplasmic metalloprotease M23B family protein [Kordiimonadales bacterium JCM 17843]GGO14436.1 periplasmic metalloprotease M23B family protein [Iodidimonas muriae]
MRRFLGILVCLVAFAPVLQAAELKGRLAQGGLVFGLAAPGSRVRLNDKPVMVAADGRFVIGFGRDAPLEQRLETIAPDGTPQVQLLQLEDRTFKIERVDGLPPKTVTPPPEYYDRRKRETGMVRKARGEISEQLFWEHGFQLPAEGRISGVYGSQRILNGKPRSPHYGLDVAAPKGTPVLAPASGIVRLAEPDFLLEGGILIIDHGFGVSSTLMHLQSLDVAVGDHVEQGQKVASLGATGRASGPHVDWRINWFDVRVDPALVLEETADAAGAP